MFLLLGFSFLAGLVTILAPCIWPVLPIILSSSIAGRNQKLRPLGITLGVVVSFTFFTLAISSLVRIFHLDPNILRLTAVFIIAFLGLMMIIPALTVRFEGLVSRLSGRFNPVTNQQNSGFFPGFITGLSLGLVWSPCAGPILATIATLAATGQVSFMVILVTLAYILGVAIPLFAFAYGGQRFLIRAHNLNKYTARIQQVFGIIMILAAIAIYTNYDQTLQLQLIAKFPTLATAVNGFENSSAVTNQLNILRNNKTAVAVNGSNELFNSNMIAPNFTGISQWLNSDKSLTISDLKGKVVLVDFWTYSCINCVRTLPYLTNWYDKYHNQGFEIIGVHTPEFQFEHDANNVQQAIKMYNIKYPVALDNDYSTWKAYGNQYWPAEYLIDAKGVIRRTHFGEGEYDQTEQAIQALLKENGQNVSSGLSNIADQTPTQSISPESYLGEKRMLYEIPDGKTALGLQNFPEQKTITLNHFGFSGNWNIADEYATSDKMAELNYNFTAGKVFLVMSPGSNLNASVQVLLDGAIIPQPISGKDVDNGVIDVNSDRLYNLVDLQGKTANHQLKLIFSTAGTRAYVFTFGN